MFIPTSRLMQADEIEAFAKIFAAGGINKIRLTAIEQRRCGNHPALSKLPVQLTFTTSGPLCMNDSLKSINKG